MGERTDAVSGDTREIRRDIDRTQREMSHTIDEIQYRLSPHYMMERTKDSVREAGLRTSHTIMDRIRENPLGAAMVGVGVFLLMRGHDHDTDAYGYGGYGYATDFDTPYGGREFSSVGEYRDLSYEGGGRIDHAKQRLSNVADEAKDRVSGAVDSAKDRVSGAVGSAKDATSDAVRSAAEQAQHLRDIARYRARNARYQARDVMRESPIVAGVAALALGAIVGALIPETDRENELMGSTRDQLLDRGKELAREGVNRATDIATAATTAATEAAKNEAKGTTTSSSTGSKTDVGRNVGI
jgi:ElaB/YqjD/DUF883 family membrane-anchored ribosome-binding protein